MYFIRKTKSWLQDRNLSALRKRVATLDVPQHHQPLVVVFANWRYLDILSNWMEAMRRLGLADYLVVSVDKKVYRYVKRCGIRTILARSGKGLTSLWILRIDVFRCLIDRGIDFIHSDCGCDLAAKSHTGVLSSREGTGSDCLARR